MKKWFFLGFILLPFSLFAAEHLKNSSEVTQAEWLRMLAGLGFVVFVIFLLSWILRKVHLLGFSGHTAMKMVSGMSLGAREKLMLVQVDGRYFLIGVAQGGVTLIHDYGTEKPAFFDQPNKSSFANVFKAVKGNTA